MSFGSDSPGGAAEGIGGHEGGIGSSGGGGGDLGGGGNERLTRGEAGYTYTTDDALQQLGMTQAEYDRYKWDQGAGHRDPTSKTYASDTWADITRSQWQDYLDNFVPYENSLLNMTTYNNPALVNTAVDKAKGFAGAGYDASNKLSADYYARYGAALDDRQLGRIQKSANIGRSAAIVGEANKIRNALRARDEEIMLGAGNNAVAAAGEYT